MTIDEEDDNGETMEEPIDTLVQDKIDFEIDQLEKRIEKLVDLLTIRLEETEDTVEKQAKEIEALKAEINELRAKKK